MKKSEQINELVSALSKAQAAMLPAKFNRTNPFFKNKYADLASCIECSRKPLTDNGLAIMQYCEMIDERLTLITMLAHSSGQYITSEYPLYTAKMDSQSLGSAITYAKRYSLSAMLCIAADEDDDAEAAHGRTKDDAKKDTQDNKKSIQDPKSKISIAHMNVLRNLESQLDEENRTKVKMWMKEKLSVEKIEDVTYEIFEKVLKVYQNACKFYAQSKSSSEEIKQ